jgi:hypothetical protein
MILVRLRGGLGNQMFQYAAGMALALRHQVALKLDLYSYRRAGSTRKFELDKFDLPYVEATDHEIGRMVGWLRLSRLVNKLSFYALRHRVYAQPHFHFDPKFLKLGPDKYLSGYFQSEKYFDSVEPALLRKCFTPKVQPNESNRRYLEQMQHAEAVSMHVRRGDLASNQKYQTFYGTLSGDYYRRAVDQVKSKVNNPVFFIFSDDLPWCEEHLDFIPDKVFVDGNSGDNSYWDLYLMSRCKHHIIANSTFSWWGAWLNDNPNKIVIAPEQKYRKRFYTGLLSSYPARWYDDKDYLPENWIKIPN